MVQLPTITAGLPPSPPASLDHFLDAAARCFARHGIRRASVQDVARELGVDRTTVYRQIGSVDSQVRLLFARDLNRVLTEVFVQLSGHNTPEALVDLVAALVTHARQHPVLAKVLSDEPELIGPFLVSDLSEVLHRVSTTLAPILQVGMDCGGLAPRDPMVMAEYLARVGLTLILAPPPGVLRDFLAELLIPVLSP
ncbi:MAG: TetR/AcrR family transcriptional regulator [Acidimicrobiales bacterium]